MMSPVRPKAIDGVMVHKKRSTTLRTSPKKPTLAKDFEPELRIKHSSVSLKELIKENEHNNDDSHIIGKQHIIVGALAILALVIAIPFFGTVTVDAYPSSVKELVSINAKTISLKSVTVKDTAVDFITAQGIENYTAYATGTVRLFNEETLPQTFAPKTRIESSDGKIYYLEDKKITVPSGIVGKPGYIDVSITASAPGAEYNQNATDFVILGWKTTNSPKVKTQYARSLTAITGGGQGTRPTVSQTELDQETVLLTAKLKQKLTDRAVKESPIGWAIVPLTETITLDKPVVTSKENQKAQISLSGTYTAKLVSRYTLGSRVSDRKNDMFNYVASDISGLRLADDQLIGTIFAEPLLTDIYVRNLLNGVSKRKITKILANETLIKSVSVKFSPFWMISVPKNPDRLRVVLHNVIPSDSKAL